MYCKQMKYMPNFVTGWQMMMVCPDCEWFKDGKCLDTRRKDAEAPCEFEIKGTKLPLKVVEIPGRELVETAQ
jgi:hypothetical protein